MDDGAAITLGTRTVGLRGFEVPFSDKARRTQEDMPMKVQTFTAVIHREDNLYVAACPEVGTVSQGTTIEDALANLKQATELYLEEFPLPDVSRPLLTTFEATYA